MKSPKPISPEGRTRTSLVDWFGRTESGIMESSERIPRCAPAVISDVEVS